MIHTLAGAFLIGAHVLIGGSDCQVTHAWEDGTAVAYCHDGETWIYDSDGQPVPGIANTPVREPGWYVAPEYWQEGPGAR